MNSLARILSILTFVSFLIILKWFEAFSAYAIIGNDRVKKQVPQDICPTSYATQ